jgi:hypothetical protein
VMRDFLDQGEVWLGKTFAEPKAKAA